MRYGNYVLIFVVFLGGCFGTTIKDVNEYGVKPMAKANILPTEAQLKGKPYRVAVFDIDDKALSLANRAAVGTSIRGALVKQVSQSNVVMVDSKALPGLNAALRKKSTRYSASKLDYALTGQVTVVNFEKGYTKLSRTKDKNGKIHVIEPYCTYSALVQGNINIHDVAHNLDVVETVALSGGANRKVTVPRHYRACRSLSQIETNSLIRSAGTKAVSREDVLLENFFRAKGYVLEHRMRGKQSIFKISLGKSNGVKADQKAEIFTQEKTRNPITNKVTLTQNKIGDGTISNKIGKKSAWVVIDDELLASQIKLGDVVMIKYEKGFLDSLFNRSFNQ